MIHYFPAPRVLCCLLGLFVLVSSVSAQESDVSRHLPTNKKGFEESAKTAGKIAPAHPLSKEQQQRIEKMLELRKNHASYIESFSKGEVRPFPQVAENWKTYVQNVADLEKLHQNILEEKDEEERQKLTDAFLLALQPLGFLLESATHEGAPIYKLTKSDKAAYDQLESEYYASFDSAKPENGEIQLLSNDHAYTLKGIPLLITLKAPAGTEIILHSELGGEFVSNKSAYIKIKANEKGIAQTHWVSHGDAVGNCPVLYSSPIAVGDGTITHRVVQLKLRPLEAISPVIRAAQTIEN